MITILTWISIIAGGILILMMLLSIIGGMDLDLDVGSTEVETDAGGLGLIKGFLTFVSVSSWIIKVLLVFDKHPGMAIGIGILSGSLAVLLLSYLFKLLMSNESNVNWKMDDALFQTGEVYLRIPAENGNGIVNINIKGAKRELKAKSMNNQKIKTGASVQVVDIDGEYVLVKEQEKLN